MNPIIQCIRHRRSIRPFDEKQIAENWRSFADPYGQNILIKWKIRTDYYAVMKLLLGYPRIGDQHPTEKPRKEGRILRA